MNYEIYLKDVLTGEVRAIPFEWNNFHPDGADERVLWIWEQGNYSCDCNRGSYFYPDDATEWSCGDSRFNLQRIANITQGHEVALVFPEAVV